MDVKDILKTAILFLNKEELLEDAYFLDEVGEDYMASSDREQEIEKLLQCLNLVYQEISAEYLPLVFEEEVTPNEGKIMLVKLSKSIQEVQKIMSVDGNRIGFKLFPDYILLNANHEKVKIRYTYEPDVLSKTSTIFNYGGKLPKRVLAYGVAMEYSFISSLSDEAYIWEARYKDSLKNIVRKKYEIKLPSRRWI